MHTFPATTLGPSCQKQAANAAPQTIISRRPLTHARRWLTLVTRWAAAVLLFGAISGCSAVRLAYGQAPSLVYWWVDDFVDLSDAQSTVLRQDIDAFFAWHRAQELPRYTELLKQWQTMATQNTTADHSCQQFDTLRTAYQRSVERSIEPFSQLALSLQPTQFEHLARHQAKSNQKFSDEWLDGGEEAKRSRLFDKALDRYETLYGDLNPGQRAALQARIAKSSFDPQRVLAERKRRQTDLQATLKQAQTQPAQATTLLRQWHNRVLNSPDPSYAAYSKMVIREGCEQYAALHNTTTQQQRAQSVKTLKQYETELLALQRPD